MLFSSYSFILYFFPACLLLSLVVRKYARFENYVLFLGISSLIFYSIDEPKLFGLIILSILFNFYLGKALQASAAYKKVILSAGIGLNVIALIYFKYTNFILSIAEDFTGNDIVYSVILPAGISFYTFHQIIYIVDTYKGKIVPHNFPSYVLYICFFPQLIAGPIVHQKPFFEQLSNPDTSKNIFENISIGLTFFAFGLAKKILIADRLDELFVSPVFDSSLTQNLTFWEAWIGTLAYTFQIYFDFSGYCDMAFGLAKCFGIELPINFNSPYKSKSLQEFWRRWHITLSTFLRDYLYIPLGGSRSGEAKKYFNIIFTMFIAGLWHGAGWGFMIWGFMHGIALCVNHYFSSLSRTINIHPVILWLTTFLFVCVAWVPFRSETLGSMLAIWTGMVSISSIVDIESQLYQEKYIPLFLALLVICLYLPNMFQLFRKRLNYIDTTSLDMVSGPLKNLYWSPKPIWAIAAATLFVLSFLFLAKINSFIYFQF